MKKKIKSLQKKCNANCLFAVILIIIIAMYWLFMIFSRCTFVEGYFMNDFTNTSMDYFNMLSNLYSLKPYADNANYPAMCFLILRVLYHMIPLIPEGNDGFYLRNYMPAQLGYIIYTIVLILGMYELLKSFCKGGEIEKKLIAFSIIISGPFVFTLERGNIILVSLLFLLFFVLLYNSENRKYRYLAYIALAFSASIKIYPALFGLMIICRKRYWEAIHTLILGVLIFFAPFWAFDGIESLKTMIYGIFLTSDIQGNLGMGYNFSFTNLIKIFFAFGGKLVEHVNGFTKVIPLLICIAIFLLCREEWKKLFAIALLCIWLPEFSYTYMLLLFIVPLIVYLRNNILMCSITDYFYRFLFIVIFVPLPLPQILEMDFENIKFPINYSTIIINIAIALMSLILVFDGAKCYVQKRNKAIKKSNTCNI